MTTQASHRARWMRWIVILGLPLVVFASCVAYDRAFMARARPPEGLATLEQFRRWKGAAVIRQGTFESAGRTYTVMMGPAGRSLPSGPAAYLFDEQGRFIDWSSDIGDAPSYRLHFDLGGGRVRSVTHGEP